MDNNIIGLSASERASDGYYELLDNIKSNFANATKNGLPLFRTDATDLYNMILEALPEEVRQYYNCNACRNFVNHYGGIVTIDEDGEQTAVMWSADAPSIFKDAVKTIKAKIHRAKVNSVFMTKNSVLGIPKTGEWHHMSVELPNNYVYDGWKELNEVIAKKNEDHKLLAGSIHKYKTDTFETAVNILRTEVLNRSEKFVGWAEWLMNVHKHVTSNEKKNRQIAHNLLWYYSATAPTGFCHIAGSMIGTLFESIENGEPINVIKRKFNDKVDPLSYQRPKAAPSAGNVARAEEIVKQLGIEKSLKRRYARLEELQTIWTPAPVKDKETSGTGVFSNVKTKEDMESKSSNKHITIPQQTMTWEKFQRTVLPNARKIEYIFHQRDPFAALCTAEYPDAPPIIQWDKPDDRNPFNWYVYATPKNKVDWNYSIYETKAEVTAIVLQPSMWKEGFDHHGKSIFLILRGCKDTYHNACGSALFPEILISDLHEVRATIEAYSHDDVLGGYEESDACGIRLQAGAEWLGEILVETDTGVTKYLLDRWD